MTSKLTRTLLPRTSMRTVDVSLQIQEKTHFPFWEPLNLLCALVYMLLLLSCSFINYHQAEFQHSQRKPNFLDKLH